mgnify:CR=1 FL=1
MARISTRSLLVALTLLSSIAVGGAAQAKNIPLAGKHNASEIKAACGASGGDFYSNPPTGEYGCITPGKGPDLVCKNKKCYAGGGSAFQPPGTGGGNGGSNDRGSSGMTGGAVGGPAG